MTAADIGELDGDAAAMRDDEEPVEPVELDALPDEPAPVKALPKPRVRTPRAATRAKRVDIKAGMENLYTMAGAAIAIIPKGRDVGFAVANQAEPCASAWASLAKDNPAVQRALERLLSVSGVGLLIAAHLPIVVAVMVATGTMPPGVAELLKDTGKPDGKS